MSDETFGLSQFELSDLLKTDTSVIIYDLRKKEDFAKGHIKKSILVKFDEEKLIDVPENSKVVLVSYDENQSKKMTQSLRDRNINAYYLIGGIKNWMQGLYCTNILYIGTGYP